MRDGICTKYSFSSGMALPGCMLHDPVKSAVDYFWLAGLRGCRRWKPQPRFKPVFSHSQGSWLRRSHILRPGNGCPVRCTEMSLAGRAKTAASRLSEQRGSRIAERWFDAMACQ